MIYNHNELKEFIKKVFICIGSNRVNAELAADCLITADLRGIDSHGIARLKGYIDLWKKKRLNINPKIKIIRDFKSISVIDADNGLGLISAPYAMNLAIKKAKKFGSSWVAVCNSNHFGIAAYHSMLALKYDMIGISMTNASPLVAPTFSIERLLGTNPISIAIPAGKELPFVLDMATSTVSNGKLEILERKNKTAPLGWLQDNKGKSVQNPSILKEGGALLPLGSDYLHSSYKGYGLGAVIDIFSGILSGANYGPWVPPFVAFLEPQKKLVGKGIGHLIAAIDINAFRPVSDFKKEMDNWIRTFKKSKTVNGKNEVLIPGELEYKTYNLRIKEGIPLNKKVINDINIIADEFNLKKPENL